MNITGLANSTIEMNEMDGDLFKKLGYEIARKINGKIIGFFSPSYPLNYFRMDIEVDKKVVSILLHQYFPYAAIVLYTLYSKSYCSFILYLPSTTIW